MKWKFQYHQIVGFPHVSPFIWAKFPSVNQPNFHKQSNLRGKWKKYLQILNKNWCLSSFLNPKHLLSLHWLNFCKHFYAKQQARKNKWSVHEKMCFSYFFSFSMKVGVCCPIFHHEWEFPFYYPGWLWLLKYDFVMLFLIK